MALVFFAFVLVCVGLLAVNIYVKRKRLPPGVRPLPGPKGLPYIGRAHDVPTEKTWLKFHEWGKEYGPIYQHTLFGTVHVWISSEKIAQDLLSKKANIYSDRPTIPNLPDNRTSGDYLALLGRTETWKRQRKLCNHLMHASTLASLHSYPAQERDRLLYLMWRDPANYIDLIEQFTTRTVARLSWGSAHPAPLLRHTTFGLLETISPAGALPNVIGLLRHVPYIISPWKQKERRRHKLETATFQANLAFVKDQMASGTAEPSFIRHFLETKAGAGAGDTREAMNVVGLMAIAGALTIGSPIQTFLLAMLHYPEWQRKLQDEIDVACEGRCPQWDDRERLPLLRAVMKEVIRWRPPVPTGIPHAIEEDDVYEGYFIPKGATVHPFEWGITRDESVYPDPETFNPARWLDPAFPTYREPLTQYPNLNGFSQFGFGRRVCQGVPIVEQDLFLSMGGMAWAFHLRRKRDPATGHETVPHWLDYSALLIAKPARFDFDAVPRSGDKMAAMSIMYNTLREKERHAADADMETESESDHHVLINVRDSSPEPDMVEKVAVRGLDEGSVAASEDALMPGAWAA